MLTVERYAEQLAAGESGRWSSATRRAAAWISPQHPTIDLGRQLPLAQLRVQALALLIYGLAAGHELGEVTAGQVLEWIFDRQVPPPPDPAASSGTAFNAALRRWRIKLDVVAQRQCSDLGELLHSGGHVVPQPGRRSLKRHSGDPVIAVWLTLVDVDDPSATRNDGLLDRYHLPLLSLGLSAIADLAT